MSFSIFGRSSGIMILKSQTSNQVSRPLVRCCSLIGMHSHHPRHRHPHPPYHTFQWRQFSSEIPGGANILPDETQEERPKLVLEAYAPTGFDVVNMIQKVDPDLDTEGGDVHLTTSILAFDRACFLWKGVHSANDVTYKSLSPILLYRPKLKYLFIGCNTPVPNFAEIKLKLKQEAGIVAEQLTIHNAMGTFNILNGEDRSVAAALVLEDTNGEEED